MSSLTEPAKKHCPRFSSGRWCFQQKKCGLIHERVIMNAAKNESQLRMNETDYGGPRVMSYVQQLNDIEAGVPPGKNNILKGSQYGSMFHYEVDQSNSAVRKKNQKHVKDAQSSNSGKSQGYYRGRKASERINHAIAVPSANNIPNTTQNGLYFNLNQSSPSLVSDQLGRVPTVKDIGPFIPSDFDFATQGPLGTFTNNTSPIYINIGPEKYKVKVVFNPGDAQVDGFSRKVLEKILVKKYWDPAGQAAGFRRPHYGSFNEGWCQYDNQETSQRNVRESRPLEKFTLFPELPFEIRLAIWQIAINFPYNPVVQLHPVRDNTGEIVFRNLICQSMTPIVLRINQESRKEALKHFKLILGNTMYLKKDTGTVFFDGNEPGDFAHFVAIVPRQELQVIKNIAVHLSEWIWEETFKEAMWDFSNIKQLVMMFSKSDDNYYLRKEAMKLIRKELKQPPENQNGWKVPGIVLVSSTLVKDFLDKNTFA